MSPTRSSIPGEIIEKDLAAGKIDAAIVWGPIAGYFAKRVRNAGARRRSAEIGARCQVRLRDRDGRALRRARMEAAVEGADRFAPAEIQAILREFGVPLVDDSYAAQK